MTTSITTEMIQKMTFCVHTQEFASKHLVRIFAA